MMKIRNGFTLVEIAIVLIIIGLFIGTVLKGTEFITNAKIKNIENNYSSIAKAVAIYRENYHTLPGDDNGANRFEGVKAVNNGNGDGSIDGNFDSTDNDDESRLLWLHLRSANLVERVSGDLQQQPQNAFGGLIGISSNSSANGAKGKNIVFFVGFTKIPGNIAIILESHSDDGLESTGRIRSNLDYTTGDNGTGNVEHKLYFSL
ncbi:MAG TPA: prepilin-type N-terminal cleavage/methylation domain-containing protein [Thioploca sp.]|nr:prepilin-type N-terminal cleavage/methylation domain-containing protein [Thioploca sp.]